MRSTEAYRVLRTHLAPTFKDAGFKRANGQLSWARPRAQAQGYLVVWFQVSRAAWDDFGGSQFTVNFELSGEPVVGANSSRCWQRFPIMLDYGGREEVRILQNGVISSLHPPPADYPPLLEYNERVRSFYFERFQPINEPYPELYDIWLRYCCEDHLATWSQFIAGKLPDWLKQMEALDAA